MGYRWCYCSGSAVEWASWWNGHLGGTGILPVSIDFGAGRMPTLLLLIRRARCPLYWYWSGGQDAHSTVIDPAGKMPTLLLFILFPIPDSRLPIPQNHKTPQRHNLAGIHDILLSGGRRIWTTDLRVMRTNYNFRCLDLPVCGLDCPFTLALNVRVPA